MLVYIACQCQQVLLYDIFQNQSRGMSLISGPVYYVYYYVPAVVQVTSVSFLHA